MRGGEEEREHLLSHITFVLQEQQLGVLLHHL
jgi:hypothetical protein